MSVIADVTIPTESFALGEALREHEDLTVEAERLASHSPEWALPFLWTSDVDADAFLEALRDDPTVEDASVVEAVDGEVLYKVRWTDDVLQLITEIIDQHASILEASATEGSWRLLLRFAEEGQVSTFQEHFAERDHAFDVHRIAHPGAPREREFGLTTEQRDALVAALEQGYFEVPREHTIEDLAEELDLSSNAVSQRLRRGSANLIRHTLTVHGSDGA